MTDNEIKNDDLNNDIDDFADDAFDDDDNFEDFETGNSLSELWKESPLIKIGAVVGVIAVIFLGTTFLGGDKNATDPKDPSISYMGGGSDVSAPPGEEEVSPVYREAIEEKNVEMIETARRTGESAIPVPLTPTVGRLEQKKDEGVSDDPLALWRKMKEDEHQQEMMVMQQDQNIDLQQGLIEQQRRDQEQRAAAYNEALQSLSEGMLEQMGTILEGVSPVGAQHIAITPADYFDEPEDTTKTASGAATGKEAAGTDGGEDNNEIVVVPAGEIEYAQILTEANSDIPGPVLGQIVSGPLSGSRIIGEFSHDDENELLTVTFRTVVVDGEAYDIDAIAVDPDTTLTGMATDVNHRYFRRVILPAAASFIQGVGEAIAESGSTSVTVTSGDTTTATEDTSNYDVKEQLFSGVQQAADQVAGFLDDEASKVKTLVRIRAGTPMGILFLSPMTMSENSSASTYSAMETASGELTAITAPNTATNAMPSASDIELMKSLLANGPLMPAGAQ